MPLLRIKERALVKSGSGVGRRHAGGMEENCCARLVIASAFQDGVGVMLPIVVVREVGPVEAVL